MFSSLRIIIKSYIRTYIHRNLLKINDLLFLNRILNGMYDFDFHNFLSITYPCDSFYYNTRSSLKLVLKVKSTRTKQAHNHFFQRIVPLSNWLMKEHNLDSFDEPNIFKPRVKQLFKRLFALDEYFIIFSLPYCLIFSHYEK